MDSIDVGNGPGVNQGLLKFTFECSGPSEQLREASHPLEVAGLYLSAVYGGKEFCRVGYYLFLSENHERELLRARL